MVAPLRPSITPSIWVWATAAPQSSRSAASDTVAANMILAIFVSFMKFLLLKRILGAGLMFIGQFNTTVDNWELSLATGVAWFNRQRSPSDASEASIPLSR